MSSNEDSADCPAVAAGSNGNSSSSSSSNDAADVSSVPARRASNGGAGAGAGAGAEQDVEVDANLSHLPSFALRRVPGDGRGGGQEVAGEEVRFSTITKVDDQVGCRKIVEDAIESSLPRSLS